MCVIVRNKHFLLKIITMKRRTLLQITIVSLIVLFLSSCSGGLSRNKAKRIIKETYGFPLVKYDTYNSLSANNQKLEQEGVLDIVKIKKPYGYSYYEKNKYILTDFGRIYTIEGRKDIFGDNSSRVVTAVLDFHDITGVKFEMDIFAQVYLRLKRREVTPWGKGMTGYMEGELVDVVVGFEKYDDGWRISNNPLSSVISASLVPELDIRKESKKGESNAKDLAKYEGTWYKEGADEAEFEISSIDNALDLILLNNEPWEESGHWGSKKIIYDKGFEDGIFTFSMKQEIDDNRRIFDYKISIKDGKMIWKGHEAAGVYEEHDWEEVYVKK